MTIREMQFISLECFMNHLVYKRVIPFKTSSETREIINKYLDDLPSVDNAELSRVLLQTSVNLRSDSES